MAVTPKELYGGTLTNTLSATLYTVPGATRAVVTSLAVTNTSGASVNLTLKVNGVAKFSAEPVAAGGRLFLGPNDIRWAMATGTTITGGGSAGSALEVSIYGAEIS